jgi:uncharacterized metal-binding protein YceD (DUF177 family)
MPLTFNLRHLDKRDLHLEGELSASDLDLAGVDDMIEMIEPLHYDLVLERLSDSVLVQGALQGALACHCVRCLKEFRYELAVENWTVDLPLGGDEKVLVTNDCVDLTPYLREDILLAFPQHPLCEAECRGLEETEHGHGEAGIRKQTNGSTSAWAELNKLKF